MAQAGYASLARASMDRGYALFRMRPKLHMQEHFSQLALSSNTAQKHGVDEYVCMQLPRIVLQYCADQGIPCLNPLSASAYVAVCASSSLIRVTKQCNQDNACWSDEDFIGRCSRVARRSGTHALSCAIRTTQKMLGAYRSQLDKQAASRA